MESATEWVECRCTTARAADRVWYSAECSGTSLVGASPATSLPSAESRDNLAGSRKPSEALVGVTSQPPSSSLTLILPDEPGVSPRSNSERPKRQMSSRSLVSLILISRFSPCLTLWQRGQAVLGRGPKTPRTRTKKPRGNADMPETAKPPVAVIGLGSMGFGMATSLKRAG